MQFCISVVTTQALKLKILQAAFDFSLINGPGMCKVRNLHPSGLSVQTEANSLTPLRLSKKNFLGHTGSLVSSPQKVECYKSAPVFYYHPDEFCYSRLGKETDRERKREYRDVGGVMGTAAECKGNMLY